MHDNLDRSPTTGSPTPTRIDGFVRFAPPMDVREIFRQMILREVRDGRLTAARRRRIVRYTAQMGLSPVEAGQLIADCRAEVFQDPEPAVLSRTPRLAEPKPRRIPPALKFMVVVAGAILVGLIVVSLRL